MLRSRLLGFRSFGIIARVHWLTFEATIAHRTPPGKLLKIPAGSLAVHIASHHSWKGSKT